MRVTQPIDWRSQEISSKGNNNLYRDVDHAKKFFCLIHSIFGSMISCSEWKG